MAAPAAAAAATVREPSALLALPHRLVAKRAEFSEAQELADRARIEARKHWPEPHPALMTKVRGKRAPYTRTLLAQLAPSQEVILGATRTAEWQRDMLALLDAHEAECRTVDARLGVPELEATADRLTEECMAIEDAIARAPARTLADWSVKAWLAFDLLGAFDASDEGASQGDVVARGLIAELQKAARIELPGVAS